MKEQKRQENNLPIKTLIDALMKSYGLDKRFKELDVIRAWKDLMGVAVAHRTEKLVIKNRVLRIKMNSSVMRDELAHGKQVIILRVNEFAGEKIIDDVWFE